MQQSHVIAPTIASSASNPVLNAEYVSFSGGGTRGFCFPAAMQAVEDFMLQYGHGHFLERIRGFSGASIGALFAMLYAAGYTSRALKEEIMGRDLNHVFANASPLNYFDKWALDDGALLEVWIEDLLERRYGKWARKMTFAQFERESRKQLVVAVTVIPENGPEYTLYVSAQNYPNKGVAHVVRISMSMVGVFSPVREPMEDTSTTGYSGNDPSSSASLLRRTALWSDGANIDSIPFKVWGGQKTLGFLLMPTKIAPIRTALDYYQRIISIFSSRSSEYYMQSLSPSERQCIVEVDSPLATIDLNTSQVDKQRMFDTASASVQRYLSRYSNELLRDAIITISRWATSAFSNGSTPPQPPPSPPPPAATTTTAKLVPEEQHREDHVESSDEVAAVTTSNSTLKALKVQFAALQAQAPQQQAE